MNASRWQKIESLYHAAQAQPASNRGVYLNQVCADDPELRREVESLLVFDGSAGGPIDRRAWDGAAGLLDDSPASELRPEIELGPYRIIDTLGAGGMGRVYRAHDLRLGREVAVKVSLDRFSERFHQEARAIAAMNHPNICTLYDVGENYMVMELLDGETLSSRIRRGKLAPDEVLRVGRQIADALAEAHSQGIVHRDLKPANIMLTRTGVKVLDFGLAKIAASSSAKDSDSEGDALMGTPAYMAPEQAKGKPAGPAADLFGLGLVLFEMAEGRPPISGVSLGRVLASGLDAKIPAISGDSRGLSSLIGQLLDPAPERRPRSAAEVRDRLDRLAERKPYSRAAMAAAALAIAAMAGVGWWAARNLIPAGKLIPERINKLTWYAGNEIDPAFSPDGHTVAFSWNGEKEGGYSLYTMRLGSQTPTRITGDSANDISPAWSPDGSLIVFLRLYSVSKGSVVVIPSKGGAERVLRDVVTNDTTSRIMRPQLTWTPDGSGIVYTDVEPESGRASLWITGLDGGAVHKFLDLDREDARGITSPAFSSDGKWVAYTEIYGPVQASLFVRPLAPGLRLAGGAIRVSSPIGGHTGSPVWSPGGKSLLYREGDELFEWKPGKGSEQIYLSSAPLGLGGMSASWGADGRTTIVTSEISHRELFSVALGRGGLSVVGEPAAFAPSPADEGNSNFSPDGKRFVFSSSRSGQKEIWMSDANGHNYVQLTHLNATTIAWARWSPDSQRVAFHSWVANKPQIYTLDLSGATVGASKKLTDAATGLYMTSWSADGKYLYVVRATGGARVMRMPAAGGRLEDLFAGGPGVVTPDGRAMVYGKAGHTGLFRKSLEGDPSTNGEEKLADDYKSPGADLNPFADGVYYISFTGEGRPRTVRFYNYASKKSAEIFRLPRPVNTPAGLAVQPDRRRMVYEQLSGIGTDLMLVEFR